MTEPSVEHQRDCYRDAIREALVNSKMVSYNMAQSLDGPHLLLALSDLTEHYQELQFRMEGLEK
jgi:hypothetical protein